MPKGSARTLLGPKLWILRSAATPKGSVHTLLRPIVFQSGLKGEPKLKVNKYNSIVRTWRGYGKPFSSFQALSWLLETFQTTLTIRFVSNFESPTTQLGSPITQIDSPNTKPGSG